MAAKRGHSIDEGMRCVHSRVKGKRINAMGGPKGNEIMTNTAENIPKNRLYLGGASLSSGCFALC
ncbi:MAG TPA: hypothetical protein VMY18_02205 [Acidobacteriota bacterium]|nr:hypothetical protein [Acidobacteriota bacterium]